MSESKQQYNIICFSNQLWDFPNWTNKRHVMSRMAQKGHNVLFVDPPINLGRVFIRQLLRGHWSLGRTATRLKKDPSGVHIYTPVSAVPFSKIAAKLHAQRIKKLSVKLLDPDKKTILWFYHVEIPSLATYLDTLDHDLLVYDCVDNYEGFPRYDTPEKKEMIRAKEQYLASKAAVVFATAPGLVDKLKHYNETVHFTPNVGDYEKFHKAVSDSQEIPDDLETITRPRVGFAGALDEYKFDFELMKEVAEKNPHVSFVLIGQIALKDRKADLSSTPLRGIENIHFLGHKPYGTLEKYYAGFDGYIIPYELNDYTVGGCFPVKFHDALAAGLPTVVTNLPAYLPFSHVSYISKSNEEFAVNVRKSLLEEDSSKIKARQKVAKENNWDGKVETMLDIVSNHI